MDKNVRASEKTAILGVINPQTITAQQFTNVMSFEDFWQILGTASLGLINSGDQIEFTAYSCDASGNNAAPIVVNGVTQQISLAASAANQNTQLQIGIRAEYLSGETYQNLKFGLSCGTTGGPAAVEARGMDCKFDPAESYNLSTVNVLD